MTNPTSSPMCCGLEAKFVNNGPSLQYYYCSECKNEVIERPSPKAFTNSYAIDIWKEFYSQMASTKLEEPLKTDFAIKKYNNYPNSHYSINSVIDIVEGQSLPNSDWVWDSSATHIKDTLRDYSNTEIDKAKLDIAQELLSLQPYTQDEIDDILDSAAFCRDSKPVPRPLAPKTVPKSIIVNVGTYLLHWYPGGIVAVDYSDTKDKETLSQVDLWNLITVSGPSYFEGTSYDDVRVIPVDDSGNVIFNRYGEMNKRKEFQMPEARPFLAEDEWYAGEDIAAGDIVKVNHKTGKLMRCR